MNLQGRELQKNCMAMLLAIAILFTSVFAINVNVFAANDSTGTVTATSLNLRAGIGTEHSSIATLNNAEVVKILDIGYDSSGKIWYQVERVDGTQGWASGSYMSVQINTDDYDLYLKLSGFPSTYMDGLKALHEKYPNWIFVPQLVDATWEEMITAQTKLGMSLTHKSNPSSWKSIQNGAYDWEKSEWIQLDSGGWVAASKELVEYYVDPRNFLTDTGLFQFLKQGYDASTMSEEEIANVKAGLVNMVKNTFLAGECVETDETYGAFTTYVDIIMEAAKISKVSPFVIASMIIQEQGNDGGGSSISGTVAGYEGFYNFLNVKAWEHSGNSAVVNGLIYAKQREWNTKTKSIIECSVYFSEGYIKAGQDTMYLKKFDLVDTYYTHQYMTNIQGAESEGIHISKAYKDATTGLYTEAAQSTALVFSIPVFRNMPETATVKPAGDGNPNYMLKEMSIAGQSLTPTFSMYETEYSLIVSNEISNVTITATPQHSSAKISGVGNISLQVGENKCDVIVTSETGGTRTYTISIIREEAAQVVPPVVEPVITSNSFTISNTDKTVTGITTVPMTAEAFAAGCSVANGTMKLYKADGTEQTGNVGTGTVLKVYSSNGTEKASYSVVVYGDTNGDGDVNALDLLRVQKHILNMSTLSGLQGNAGDTSKNGTIDALDLLQVQKHIIGVKAIAQSK